MNLTLVGLSVVLSFWRREFYNALQDKDWKAFLELLFLFRKTASGLMPGFCEVAAVHIVLAVYSVYLNQLLQIRWRRWLTRKFLHRMAGRPRLLQHQPDGGSGGGRNRQPGSAHIRGSARFHPDDPVAYPRLAVEHRLALQFYRHPVGIVRRDRGVRHPDPRLHGVGRAGLRRSSAPR